MLANVKMQIYNSPDHLILQLKRFTMSARTGFMGRMYGSRRKDSQTVSFPDTNLDMSDYVINKKDTVQMFLKRPSYEDVGMTEEAR